MDNSLYTVQKRKYVLTDIGLVQLVQDYNLGYSQQKIAKKFGVSEDTVRIWMKENQIPTRKRKYSINETYFDVLIAPEQAYWLGFLSADGYVHNERGEIQLQLQGADQNHVQKFADTIGSNKPLMKILCGDEQQYTAYRFVIRCRHMVDTLQKYNIVQAKSLSFYPINIPDNLFKYWILGYMDGDGCIFQTKNRIKISFTGTEKTLSMIKNALNSTNVITKEHRCENTYKFTLEVDKSEAFLKEMKYNELPYVLERKKQRYCSFI